MSRLVLMMVVLAVPGFGRAHGINGHVHVTGWAIAQLPPGELKDFFADPEVRDAALLGAAFPDSGYAIDNNYGELAHWPPFVEAYRLHLLAAVGPPFDTLEKRKHAAFWMGMACHGLQDEMFDSVFLHHVREKDGQGQDAADPGTDAFLHTDGYLRFKPAFYAPLEDLALVFASAHGHEVETSTIEAGLRRVKLLVIDGFAPSAERLDALHRPNLPWTAAHYLDPNVPGSLGAEIPATAAFLQATWDRLHDRYPPEQLVVHPWPSPGRRLVRNDAASVDSWITLILGAGAPRGDFPERVALADAAGDPVPFDLFYTRWSSQPDDLTRILQLRPRQDLAADSTYSVQVAGGATRVDGVVSGDWSHPVQSACADCPPVDGGWPPLADMAVPDMAVPDMAPDAAVDAAPDVAPDARVETPDMPQDSAVDATLADGALPDAGIAAEAGDSGCSSVDPSPWLALLLLAARRRR